MTIYAGSRYAPQTILQVFDVERDNTYPTVYGPAPTITQTFTNYVVQAGDRFDTLAYKVFGDPTLWWQIADENPEVFYPDMLVPGTMIRLPVAS
jgi:hypothetical protein